MGEGALSEVRQQWARDMNTKSLTGHPMFLKPGRPKAGRGGILQTTSFYNLPSSSPSFLLFHGPSDCGERGAGGAVGELGGGVSKGVVWGHLCPMGKVDVGSRERISFPSTGERRAVSLSAPQTAFLPQREDASCPRADPHINGVTPLRLFRQLPDTPLCSWQNSFWSS